MNSCLTAEKDFNGFRNQAEERAQCRRIVINSELFYLSGIRGIIKSFGLDSAPFALLKHGGLAPACKRVFMCACAHFLCLRPLQSRRLRVSVPEGL